ncbi:type VI secretion system baseplate subunit TssF [Escherichia coli]|nr:type VI secretion system baseplate subunit TssF [Escherichia coli]
MRRDSLRLYCAPAINLFIHHAEAIHAGQPAGRLSAGSQPPLSEHYDVFSVNGVISQVQDMFRKKILGRPVFERRRAPVACL